MLRKPTHIDLTDFTLLEVARVAEENAKLLEKVMAAALSFTVTFTSGVEIAEFVVKDADGEEVTTDTPGTYILPFGSYTYSASADGYLPLVDIPFIANANKAFTVNLVLEVYTLEIIPSGVDPEAEVAIVLVNESGEEQVAVEGIYTLVPGTYTYTITVDGYGIETGDIEIVDDDVEFIAIMTPIYTVTFTVTGTEVGEEITYTILDADGNLVPSSENVFTGPAGVYTYTIACEGYFDVTGIVEIVDEDITVEEVMAVEEYSVTISAYDSVSEEPIAEPTIVVTDSESNPVDAVEGVYTLVPGTYTYTINATSYTEATDTFTVVDANLDLDIALVLS